MPDESATLATAAPASSTAPAAPAAPAATAAPAAPAAVVSSAAETAAATPEAKAAAAAVKAKADGEAAAKAAALAKETPEQKTAREAQEAASAAAKAVPEKYDLKVPDGVTRDAAFDTEFSTLAKELKLPQAEAQRLYDLRNKAVAAQAENIKATQASWLEASKADKEFGGEKLAENMSIAKKALELNPAIKQLLNDSRLGDHPEMIRWMYRVGKAMSEDKFVAGAPTAGQVDAAKKLYPNQA